MAKNKCTVLLFAMLLFAAPIFSVWSQKLIVSATSANGQPVDGALVEITYQKDNSLSQSDGLISGKTGSSGTFETELVNSVPLDYQNRNVLVNVSTFFWPGEKRSVLADSPDVKKVVFAVPFSVEGITVRVLDSRNAPVSGTEVKMDGEKTGRLTDNSGEAVVQAPVGVVFGGSASYGNVSVKFNSSQASQKIITVTLPLLSEGNATAANGFMVQIEDANGKPVAGQDLNVSFAAENDAPAVYSIKTDSFGNALLVYGKTGALNLTFRRNEYDYAYQFNVTGPESRKIMLEALLKISSFSEETLSENCYKVSANVTDPRTSVPIEVRMMIVSPTNKSIAVQATEPDVFVSSVCVDSNSQVQVIASDRYETAESEPLNLTYTVPYVPPYVPPPPKKEELDTRTLVMAAGGLLIVIVLVAGIYIIRKRKANEEEKPAVAPVEKIPIDPIYQIEKFLRPITVYARKTVELLTKKKKRKPPTPIPPAVG